MFTPLKVEIDKSEEIPLPSIKSWAKELEHRLISVGSSPTENTFKQELVAEIRRFTGVDLNNDIQARMDESVDKPNRWLTF